MASPTPTFNSKSPTIRRILREAHELTTSPSPDFHASLSKPTSTNGTSLFAGLPTPLPIRHLPRAHLLPPTYPFRFLTPSGRFETNREICLSISGHHEETWQPAWGSARRLWR
ncbi:hypothetical protein N0V88_001145 [Collariella sp. IMI 366227]|nr:hypothetical protein N0V88_001145 [Collariella sp. IMI 366227]